MGEPGWSVIVPVKRVAEAKTRLRTGTDNVAHGRLVLAMTQDTVQAVVACPAVVEVLVVTDDPEVSALVRELGARVLRDRPGAGLNAAVGHGATVAARTRRWTAALAADLPSLRPAELAAALAVAVDSGRRGFVPDAGGAGTTLLTAPPGWAIEPRFGPDSAARHAASGARRLDGDWPTLRRDVDTPSDLVAADRLGLGPFTMAVWRELAR